jgi:hypothetical protein
MKGVGGLNGWRWIFILVSFQSSSNTYYLADNFYQEGLLTVVVAAMAYYFIANYPNNAKFITDNERTFIHRRLKDDSDATRHEGFTWANVGSAIKDPKCWLYGFAFHTLSLPLYTLSLFLVSAL